jgi:hypothetical protein
MKTLKIFGYIIGGFILLMIVSAIIGSFVGKPKPQPTSNEAPAKKEVVIPKEDIEILSKSESESYGMRTVHVQVRNNTDKLLTNLILKSVYYDKAGGVVGTGMGGSMNIASGAVKTVDIPTMGIEGAATYNVEIEASLFD